MTDEGFQTQRTIIGKMTPDQKYRASMGLLRSAIMLKEASLKSWRPDLDERTRKTILRDYILYARE